jgi:MATE family multidrug resistance protein
MYITFVAYWVIGFPISYWAKYALKAVGMDRTLGRINSGSYYFYTFALRDLQKLVLQNHKE